MKRSRLTPPIAALAATAMLSPVAALAASPAAHASSTPKPPARTGRLVHPRYAATSAGRAQLTLSMTDVQTQAIYETYWSCLKRHGFPSYPGRGDSPVQTAHDPAAQQACANLQPLEPVALNPALNPHYSTDLADAISCMQAQGDPVTSGSGPADMWTYANSTTARGRYLLSRAGESARNAIEQTCELNAFGPDDHPATS